MTELFARTALIFFASVACDIVVMRLRRQRSSLMRAAAPTYLVFAIGLVVWLAHADRMHETVGLLRLIDLGFALFVFTTFWITLRLVLVCAQNSLTLRMLSELSQTPGVSLTLDELLARLPDERSVGARLDAMAASRLVRTSAVSGSCVIELQARGRVLARAAITLRRVATG